MSSRYLNSLPYVRMVGLLGCLASFCSLVEGQEVSRLLAQPAPYYVGEPVVMQITVADLSPSIQPSCQLASPLPDGVSISAPQMSQSYRELVEFGLGGRPTRRERMSYTFQFVVMSTKSGDFEVGPFEVEYDGQKVSVAGRTFAFQELQDDEDLQLDVSLATSEVYVGQRVPVSIRWGMAGEFHEIEYAFRNLEIRSPLFDQFEFVNVRPKSRTTLSIATAKGVVAVDAQQTQETRDGKSYLVLASEMEMVATAAGEFSLPVTCRTKRGKRWRRRFLGGVEPSETVPAKASGEAIQFRVKPLPLENRPSSFAGAVGDAYDVEVTANRTVVRVGDPIALTVNLRGRGLERLSLPNWSSEDAFSSEQFQVPSEPPAGNYDGSVKQFKLNVRVKDLAVEQIPELPYSWFDPERGEYVTVRSKPIALQVMPAQVMSAEHVVSAQSEAGQVSTLEAPPAVSELLEIRGANLAIEDALPRLLRRRGTLFATAAWRWSAYGLGVLAVLAAVVVRRRSAVDPAVMERKTLVQACRRELMAAQTKSGKAAVEVVASALRRLLVTSDPELRRDIEQLVARCEQAVYAPQETTDAATFVTQALDLLRRYER